jgi:hypothetical protein
MSAITIERSAESVMIFVVSYLSVHRLNSFDLISKSSCGRPPRKPCNTCHAATAESSVVSKAVAFMTGYLPCAPAKELFSKSPLTGKIGQPTFT